MRIICEKHGFQPGLHSSPDLADDIHSGRPVPPFREVTYCYEGPYIKNFLSESFATENGAVEVGDVELPDDYPSWYGKMVPICERCLEEAIGRPIDAT